MKITRRNVIKTGLTAAAALSFHRTLLAQGTQGTSGSNQTVRMVKTGDLRVFDPIFTTAYITADHGAAIYDTLFALNSKLEPQPQMVSRWNISDDKRTYTFELRDGLSWHDDTPVTASDVVASIKRWTEVSPGGQLIKSLATDISKKDNKTFVIALKEPLGLLIDILATGSTPCLYIMREKDANTPPTEQVTANIGSGPFKFNQALARPGASFTYDRNAKYIPRAEPTDGLAGGKVVKVERVVWNNMPDQQTALAALQTGEIDYDEAPPMDLLPVLKGNPDVALQVLNKGGKDYYARLNFLQKPFNNVKARQAMLYLVDQEAAMLTTYPREYVNTITSLFGTKTTYTNDENTKWFKKGGDPERAKQLFQEAGYAGEKVVILQPANVAILSNAAQYLAGALRKIGVNVELAPSDWGGVVARRGNKGPVENGGWSIFLTSDTDYAMGDVLGNSFFLANGDQAWYGWPKSDRYEALRAEWTRVATTEERKALARQMQHEWWDFVGSVFIGQAIAPIARRSNLTELIETPLIVPMWHMQKA